MSSVCHDGMVSRLLQRARGGEASAFAELTEPYRRELHVHCYRMLGSVDDADDALQETMIAAWHGIAGYAERASVRTWLYTIATRRCLNAIRDQGRRPPPAPQPPFDPPEPSAMDSVRWLQPYPGGAAEPAASVESAETITVALVAALQHLPPRQTAALLLADVLGFSPAEIAAMLEETSTTVKGLLQRARARMPLTAERNARAGADDQLLAERFATAFARDDIGTLVELLTEQSWLSMPPAPHRYRGRDAVVGFLRASARHRAGRHFRLLPVIANGHPAFASYLSGETFAELPATPSTLQRATGVIVPDLACGRVAGITHFLDPRMHEQFGLPAGLPITGH
ncbi:RNA polymerase subunit sigma-70 [Microlunatus soli]|uniref:RNA polymerase, sigma subunit, ECF family n=1 Tax=Microlunatus soli TaxID=630515 RepID=A0A1H1UUY2_9ACTN|nr:RNA polymerase subunit sigma-70 [Microlunatus soli]SDS75896.1 RNA polymerase, sigma subunit, ECF family [Microlunatus soli]